jgi:hypothetical protein
VDFEELFEIEFVYPKGIITGIDALREKGEGLLVARTILSICPL